MMKKEHFENIVVPINFNEDTGLILKQAYILSQFMNTEVSIVFSKNKCLENNIENVTLINEKLLSLANQMQEKYDVRFYPVLFENDNNFDLIDFVKDNYARLIIVSRKSNKSENLNKKSLELEGIEIDFLWKVSAPVLIIEKEIIYEIDKILLPLDLKKNTIFKLNWAAYYARLFGCIVKVITVISDEDDKEYFSERIEGIKKDLNDKNVFCTTDVIVKKDRKQDIGEIIANYGVKNHCDLILLMTQEESFYLKNNIGTTAFSIMTSSEKPIILLNPNTRFEHF